jgi:AcrR family transcriptional regulator
VHDKILQACIRLFNEKGCRFTLDDIVAELKISRKTFYKYYLSKEDVLKEIIDVMHGAVYPQQCDIFEDSTLSTEEKLYRCLTLRLPHEDEIDLNRIYEIEQYYPEVYAYFMGVYEQGWELTETLLRRGMEEGVFRTQSVELVRSLLESGLKMLYQGDFLQRSGLVYHKALEETVSIILRGIRAEEAKTC